LKCISECRDVIGDAYESGCNLSHIKKLKIPTVRWKLLETIVSNHGAPNWSCRSRRMNPGTYRLGIYSAADKHDRERDELLVLVAMPAA